MTRVRRQRLAGRSSFCGFRRFQWVGDLHHHEDRGFYRTCLFASLRQGWGRGYRFTWRLCKDTLWHGTDKEIGTRKGSCVWRWRGQDLRWSYLRWS